MSLRNVIRTPSEILATHRIASGGRRSAYTTTCPRCSHTRRKERDRWLSVLIDGRGVRWKCHYCSWKGGEFYNGRPAGESKPFVPLKCDINDDRGRIKRAQEIWNESNNPIGTVVEKYLNRRELSLDGNIADQVIRFHRACPWRDDETDRPIRVPAMVAAMRDIRTDELQAIQVTALRPDGSKFGRRTRGVAAGTYIKLSPDDAVEHGLTIGEGFETVLAGMRLLSGVGLRRHQ